MIAMRPPRAYLPMRVAIVGTGYIADFHARAIRAVPGAELVSVCDANLQSARSFAGDWRVPKVFESFETMLEQERIDVVHVLTPPDSHYSIAKSALRAGVSVFLEKPMCPSVSEADELLNEARTLGLTVGVNHNFLFSGAYQILRRAVRSNTLGPLDHISINWFLELPQIRLGPFDAWMLRGPENALLEVAPHPVSMLLDLTGSVGTISVTADRKTVLPTGIPVFRRWRVHSVVGPTSVDINIHVGPGFTQRTIAVRGLVGSAMFDFDANTCFVDRHTPLNVDLDRYRRCLSLAHQIRSQARTTLADYAFSKLGIRLRGNPYQVSIIDSVAAFYSGMRSSGVLDNRIAGESGRNTIEYCRKIAGSASLGVVSPRRSSTGPRPIVNPTVLVIGGAGFIGRELTRQLLKAGYHVRVMVRKSGSALEEFATEKLEIVRGDLRNQTDLATAMQGIEFVYDLATSVQKTWDASLRNIVEPTRIVGEACLAAKISRLIYAGTIDSYYAGAMAGVITEETSLDRRIARRNYYARAKAAAEAELTDLYRKRGLPVVIFRPGIVIGRGGNPFHWGVGKFSENVCEVWGDGTNKLPFVLVTDVAAALLRGIQVRSIEGRSYNLIDIPLLSARDYLQELQRLSGIPLSIYYRPIWQFYLSDLAKWTVKVAARHPDRYRIPSHRDWESRTQKAIFDCTRARAELAWAPASDRQKIVEEGIGGSLQPWLEAVS
jgi:predicted dehydrogenase/nucleoside-diphosphate-sugar epimerase